MMVYMDENEARRRVGFEVQRRRTLRGVDQALLSTAAKADPKTVRSLEKGDRWPREASRTKIERTLEWPAGMLERLRSEALANASFDDPLPSATEVNPPDRQYTSIAGYMAHPSRSPMVPEGKAIPYRGIIDLVDSARRVYIALEDIANGDAPEKVLADAARLHSAATRVAFEWAGGAQGFGDLAQTMPELAKEISRSPDAAMKLLERIRERNAS